MSRSDQVSEQLPDPVFEGKAQSGDGKKEMLFYWSQREDKGILEK
jgi:hypothetical protein